MHIPGAVRRTARITVAAFILMGALALPVASRTARAGILGPQVDQAIVIALVADKITLTGAIGTGSARSITFTFPDGQVTLPASSPLVERWDVGEITTRIPPEVRSGSLIVTVDGRSSAPVQILVFDLTQTSTQLASNVDALPNAIAVAPDHTVWINDEFHTQIKSATAANAPVVTAVGIPQAPGPGIFAIPEVRTTYNVMGEDIVVEADGSVWFQQGGAYLYDGALINSSRIVRYVPSSGTFSCYNVPQDNAQVGGLVIDRLRGMVWYTAASFTDGGFIGGFSRADAVSDCTWDPATAPRTPDCSTQPVPGCHSRLPLPQSNTSPMNIVIDASGDLWFTEYLGNRIGRLDPDTGVVTELPLPPPIAHTGPGSMFGAGPFDIDLDAGGNLWVTEQFDATISVVRPSLMSSNNCTQLNLVQRNPCITEVWVGSDGFDDQTVSYGEVGVDGRFWFAVSANQAGLARLAPVTGNNISTVGVVSPALGNAVALLPPFSGVPSISGIAQDRDTRDIWFGEHSARRLVRLREATGDGDGIPDASDNCPNAYNPGQENHDSVIDQTPPKTVDDRTWLKSDDIGDACDTDDDNDGFADTVELAGAPCPSASGPTNPLAWDSDGDRFVDNVECAMGSDPASATSKPSAPLFQEDPDRDGLAYTTESAIGSDPNRADTDGDGLRDGVEYRYYGSNPIRSDTDGDAMLDQCEVSSINTDMVVNVGDQALLTSEIIRAVPAAQKLVNFDLNKDGVINVGDQAFQASNVIPGRC